MKKIKAISDCTFEIHDRKFVFEKNKTYPVSIATETFKDYFVEVKETEAPKTEKATKVITEEAPKVKEEILTDDSSDVVVETEEVKETPKKTTRRASRTRKTSKKEEK